MGFVKIKVVNANVDDFVTAVIDSIFSLFNIHYGSSLFWIKPGSHTHFPFFKIRACVSLHEVHYLV